MATSHTPSEARARLVGWLAAFGSTVAFSIASPITTAIFTTGAHPNVVVAVRLALSATLLFGTLAAASPGRLRIDRRGLLITLVAGLATGASLLLFIWSLTRLDTSIAAMLFSLYPLVVLGLLALRGEKLTARHLVRLALGLAGVYLLIGGGGRADVIGVLLVVGSVLAASLQTVFIQWFLRGYNGLTITLYMVTGMMVVAVGWWAAQGPGWTPLAWQAWAGIVVLAVVCTYLARVAMFTALMRLGGSQVTLLVPLETLLTVLWSVLFLGERLTPMQALGSAFILLSAALAAQRLRRVKAGGLSAGLTARRD